jgi:RNA polymerase sigma-70 factor (ECF subfamily)
MDAIITVSIPALDTPRKTASPRASVENQNRTTAIESDPSDETLISRIVEGNREALGVLFRRHARIVRGVAYRVLRDPSEADDLLQDVFLLIHRLSGTFDPSKGPARFWILQMTYRRAISRRRYLSARHYYNRLNVEGAAEEPGRVLTNLDHSENSMIQGYERKQALEGWDRDLSDSQRKTLHLFFFEGYTFEEIATKLGQSVGNARNHYYRGLEKLRKQISAGRLPGKEAV